MIHELLPRVVGGESLSEEQAFGVMQDVLAGAGYACAAYGAVVLVQRWLSGSVRSVDVSLDEEVSLTEQVPCELNH